VVGPFVGIGLMNLGVSEPTIFAIGCGLIAVAWLCMGSVVPGVRVVAVGSRQ
jgi:hypothetical protein